MPPRKAEELDRAARAESLERLRVPIMFGAILLVVLLSRFSGTRVAAAQIAAFGFPLLGAAVGAVKFVDSSPTLRGLAFAAAAVAALTAEALVATAFAPGSALSALAPPTTVAWVLFVGAVLAGAAAQAGAKNRGMRSFLAAWLGMVAAWGLYLPAHRVGGKDAFDAILGAGLVSLFAGGGPGVVAGAIATRLFGR